LFNVLFITDCRKAVDGSGIDSSDIIIPRSVATFGKANMFIKKGKTVIQITFQILLGG